MFTGAFARTGIIALILVISGSACATWETPDVPLPPNAKVVPPSPALPEDLARFSGAWKGMWGGIQNHLLVVEQISPRGATVIYAWGATPKLDRTWAGHERTEGQWQDGSLVLVLRDGAEVTYRMNPDGTLLGRYRKGASESMSTLRKLP